MIFQLHYFVYIYKLVLFWKNNKKIPKYFLSIFKLIYSVWIHGFLLYSISYLLLIFWFLNCHRFDHRSLFKLTCMFPWQAPPSLSISFHYGQKEVLGSSYFYTVPSLELTISPCGPGFFQTTKLYRLTRERFWNLNAHPQSLSYHIGNALCNIQLVCKMYRYIVYIEANSVF